MNTSLYVKRFETGTTVDVTEDFSLPDYQPEIRRIVGVRASAASDGKYLTGDELECDGNVTYTVLYISGNGEMAQSSQTSSYTGRIPLGESDDRFSTGDIVLACSAENAGCRVTGPRKFTLSSRVRISAMSQKQADAALKTDEKSVSLVRRRTEERTAASMLEVRKNAEVSGDVREREGAQVIMAHGEVSLSDVRVNRANGDVSIKGDAYVSMLLLTPEGEYVTSRGRAPIEESVQLPDTAANTNIRAAAFGNVVLIELEVGGDGMISWHMEYDIDCDIMKCSVAEVTADAYLTGCEDRLTVSEFDSYVPALAVNGRLTTSTTAKLKEGMTYIHSWGGGSLERCEISGSRATFGGSVKLNIVMAGGGEASCEEVSIPLKYECEAADGIGDLTDANLTKRTQVNVSDISVRIDGDTMNITSELSIAAIAIGREKVSAATAISSVGSQNDGVRERKNVIRVYVPDRDESAWDVEKKFRLGREAVLEGEAYII